MPLFKQHENLESGSSASSLAFSGPYVPPSVSGEDFSFKRTSSIEGIKDLLEVYVNGFTPSGSASSNAQNSDTASSDALAQYLRDLSQSQAETVRNNMKYNAEQARLAREFNAKEAQKLRDWQENLSNTSYQRAMKDMLAAGLNPILAFSQGGAGVPSGSSASANAASSNANAGTNIAEILGALAKLLGPLGGAVLGALFA